MQRTSLFTDNMFSEAKAKVCREPHAAQIPAQNQYETAHAQHVHCYANLKGTRLVNKAEPHQK